MGGAQSSNAASAVSKVTNSINNSTVANSDQVSAAIQSESLNNCVIIVENDADFTESATVGIKNQQIIDDVLHFRIQTD